MKLAKTLLLGVTFPLLSISCGGGTTPQETKQSVTCTDGNITMNEMNDYKFMSTITLPPITVKAKSDLTFEWGSVTKDFLGKSINVGSDIKSAIVMLWTWPLNEFQKHLNDDDLPLNFLTTSVPPNFTPNGATTAKLYDFTVGGEKVDQVTFEAYLDPAMYPPDKNSFLFAIQDSTEAGEGSRMLQAFQIDSSSSNTTVKMTNDSTKLTYTANLHDLHPTGVPSGKANLKLDYSKLKTSALGVDISDELNYISDVLVAHYSQTPAQLEKDFLNLRELATDIYSGCIGDSPCPNPPGYSVDLSVLKDSSGHTFPGVDGNGTWLVAFTCGNCHNPAPWYLTILEPADQPCK